MRVHVSVQYILAIVAVTVLQMVDDGYEAA